LEAIKKVCDLINKTAAAEMQKPTNSAGMAPQNSSAAAIVPQNKLY
jgi:hypothetical protein